MDTKEAFQAALKEKPDDLLLRSVYRDWLEEQGDPQWADYVIPARAYTATGLTGGEVCFIVFVVMPAMASAFLLAFITLIAVMYGVVSAVGWCVSVIRG